MFKDDTQSYVVIKALSDDVSIIGLTRGEETRTQHTEKLGAGEIMIAQFTERVSAIKVKGNAEVYTAYGVIKTGKN
ncbi:MAG TPA: trp RNA-binding attenuation protein MtrB [Clostridiales bacterium]|jgi:transcription attenuation protein (tryptophan RNA-binding attenuator protein)|nr:trp RNA-binding attenuation protein MtrB [Clostridiales bacterium]